MRAAVCQTGSSSTPSMLGGVSVRVGDTRGRPGRRPKDSGVANAVAGAADVGGAAPRPSREGSWAVAGALIPNRASAQRVTGTWTAMDLKGDYPESGERRRSKGDTS